MWLALQSEPIDGRSHPVCGVLEPAGCLQMETQARWIQTGYRDSKAVLHDPIRGGRFKETVFVFECALNQSLYRLWTKYFHGI